MIGSRRRMRRHLVARGAIWVGAVLAGAGSLSALGAHGGVVAEALAQSSGAAASCTLRGVAPVTKGVELWEAASGGRALARFTGAPIALTVSDVPSDATGRARVGTSTGQGLRIDGYVHAPSLPAYTVRDVDVVPGHVWIAAGERVKLSGASAGALAVERTVSGSAGQVVRASGPCEALALSPAGHRTMEVPGNGRGYVTRTPTLDLFGEPNKTSVLTLRMSEGAALLFWSTETRGNFVRVASRGDIVIDAWARRSDLEPLKKGEMMDQVAAPQTVVDGATLALDKPPPLVRATKDVPVRALRDEKERPIGMLEAGAEVYVMERIAAFTNVLPKGLGLMPAEGLGFWIPTSEVPQ